MLKFLLVLVIIFFGILLILGVFLKKFLNLFGLGTKSSFKQDFANEREKQRDGEVIYNKDDVVVMKGEAKKKDQ